MQDKTRQDKTRQDPVTDEFVNLRLRAEAAMQEKVVDSLDVSTLPTKELQALVHELQVHQIELEMQNEEIKRLHLESEASKKKYQDLYDFAPVGYLTLSRKGIITEVNLTGASLLGVARQKLINRGFGHFVDDESLGQFDIHISSVLKQQEKLSCDLRLKREDGSSLYVKLESIRKDVSTEEQEKTGETQGILMAVTDITEIKRGEQEVRNFKIMTDRANYGCAMTDVDGFPTYVNEAFANMHGFSSAELIGENLSVFHTNEQMEHVNRLLEKLSRDGAAEFQEVWHARKDGSVFPTLMSLSLINDNKGTPLLFTATAIDITERKQAEEDLRISEDKFSKAFHINPDAILITRLDDGMIVMVNEGFMQIFGATEEEVIGKTSLELNIYVNPEDRNSVIEGLKAKGKVNNFEFNFRNKDGDVRSGLMSASIITLDGVVHVLSITRDVTESKMAREQLFQSQKMEAIGTLAGGFAHDFNNKLQVIDGYVDLILSNKDLTNTVKSELGIIRHTVDISAELIKGMMVFSRKTPVELQPIELNKLVAQFRSMLAPVMPKTIDIDLVEADDLWAINAVPNQIDQILMNLAINARDAMPDGGRLTIKTQNKLLDQEFLRPYPHTKPGHYVLISVTDSGKGMDKETASHIFEPFFTTKEPGKGTGLGLAVVYGIVEQHSGMIICDSKPSVGTTFSIYLPAIEEVLEE